MVATPIRVRDHPIAWVPPPPFWADTNGREIQGPKILRFAQDDFMDQLQRLLATDPERLRELLAVPETWRGIRQPAWTPNPAAGTVGRLGRLGISSRRTRNPQTLRPQPSSDAAGMDLKLYQPAHQRFYLIGACLVCQQPGLPDRRIDKGKLERASFVIRRWFPPGGGLQDDNLPPFDESTWTEHAFVGTPNSKFTWQAVAGSGSPDAHRRVVLQEEERLPLFPMGFSEDDQRPRRLLAGLIPVGRREAYMAASRLALGGIPAGGGPTSGTGMLSLFRKTVSEPWKSLVDRAALFRRSVYIDQTASPNGVFKPPQLDPPDGRIDDLHRRFRSDCQTASWLLLVDLRAYLRTYSNAVWQQVLATTDFSNGGTPGSLTGNPLKLYNSLLATQYEANPSSNPTRTSNLLSEVDASRKTMASCLGHALKLLESPNDTVVSNMENAENAFQWTAASPGWPSFVFPIVEVQELEFDSFATSPVPSISNPPTLPDDEQDFGAAAGGPTGTTNIYSELATAVAGFKAAIDSFAALVMLSIDPVAGAPVPPVPTAADRPADARPGWFTIRCVYERPHCGKLHDDVVSASSDRFQLAGFFDPDAPARPIRIGLPIDTSPAGLRKFDRNTAFVMSDILCGQIARMRGLTFGDLVLSVLPFPFHKDISVPDGGPCKTGGGLNVGLICSLSIPIITLCALILLIIMVSLLDFIFRWMPYFIICFPLPGLRAKRK